jgi:hypothetical protein
MDRDADESAKLSFKMGGNLNTIPYFCLVQILPLIKKNVCSYLTSYAITKILQ